MFLRSGGILLYHGFYIQVVNHIWDSAREKIMMTKQKYAPKSERTYEELYKKWIDFIKIYKVHNDGVRSVSQFIEAIEKREYACKLSSKIENFVYRGESQTYTTFLQPIIARNTNQFSPLKSGKNITKKETGIIRQFQKSKYGKPYSKELSGDEVYWALLAQHYRYPTRLLDATQNALVALYFACEKNVDKDGWVFYFDKKDFRPRCIPKTFLELYENTPEHTPCLLELRELSPEIWVVLKRIIAQSSVFIWWHPFTEQILKHKHLPILINNEAKNQIKQDLDRIFNINKEFLFPPD